MYVNFLAFMVKTLIASSSHASMPKDSDIMFPSQVAMTSPPIVFSLLGLAMLEYGTLLKENNSTSSSLRQSHYVFGASDFAQMITSFTSITTKCLLLTLFQRQLNITWADNPSHNSISSLHYPSVVGNPVSK